MAFVESWVETDPDGSVITGSLLDDYQRQSKRAMRERLEGDPSNPNSGIFESGSFSASAIVRAGTARAYAVTTAGLGALTLQDGRLAVTTDTNRLYHLKASGMVELGYALVGGGAYTFAVNKLVSNATATFGGTLAAAGFQLYGDPVYGAVLAGFGSTSEVALATRGGSIALRTVGNSADLLAGGALTVTGLLTIYGNIGLQFNGVDAGLYQITNRIYLGQYSSSSFALSIDYTTGNLTVPGSLAVAGAIAVTASTGAGQGTIYWTSVDGLILQGKTASSYDFSLLTATGGYLLRQPTGTANLQIPNGNLTVGSGVTVSAGALNVTNTVSGVASFIGSAVDPMVLIARSDNAANNSSTIRLGTNNGGFQANNAFIRARQGSGIDSWILDFGASNNGGGGVASQLMSLDIANGVQHFVKSSFSANISLGTNAAINNGTASAAVATSTPTTVGTITTPSAASTYVVTATIDNAGFNGAGFMVVSYSPASGIWTATTASYGGSISVLSMAGNQIRIQQSTGSTLNITTAWTKIL